MGRRTSLARDPRAPDVPDHARLPAAPRPAVPGTVPPAAALLALQATAGNQAVARLLQARADTLQRVDVEPLDRPRTPHEAYAQLNRYAGGIPAYDHDAFNGGIFTIGATHTGDMYDVALARAVIGHSLVVIWGVNDASVFKAAEIARFLGDAGSVRWIRDPPPPDTWFDRTKPEDLRALAAGHGQNRPHWIREGGATTIVSAFAGSGGADDVPELMAPEVTAQGEDHNRDAAMLADLRQHGFDTGEPYVLVNFRQSGHSGVGNAPALDTGEEGFRQLIDAISRLGYTPVPMGEFDPFPAAPPVPPAPAPREGEGEDEEPMEVVPPPPRAKLVNYWTWPSVSRLGRRAEARLLRVMVRNFHILGAVGMRSGVTDLLRYVGVPTLSIDIHPRRGQVAKGWQRSLKRERAFDSFKIVSLLHERQGESTPGAHWPGAFHADDLAAIVQEFEQLQAGRAGPATSQHPQATGGIHRYTQRLLEDVRDRRRLIRESQRAPAPMPAAAAPGGRRMSALEEIRMMNEASKLQGLGLGQVAEHRAHLRAMGPVIDNLLEWLADRFVEETRDVRWALQDLRDARAEVEDAL